MFMPELLKASSAICLKRKKTTTTTYIQHSFPFSPSSTSLLQTICSIVTDMMGEYMYMLPFSQEV